jgi:hypothetical protein
MSLITKFFLIAAAFALSGTFYHYRIKPWLGKKGKK